MIAGIIRWSIGNRFLVVMLTLLVSIVALTRTDARLGPSAAASNVSALRVRYFSMDNHSPSPGSLWLSSRIFLQSRQIGRISS